MTMHHISKSHKILADLIAFASISHRSNLDLIEYVSSFLATRNIKSQLIANEEGNKANLYATIGPANIGGIMLSGHSDVVPVEGQDWSSDPFEMIERSGNLFGRGTADMKGFIACVLSMIANIDPEQLKIPIHLAISFDEEIGCVGVRRLIDMLKNAPVRPTMCIVGEPTMMKIVHAHKGKIAGRISCHGQECHSSLAPEGLNAIYLANDIIGKIRDIQDDIILNGAHDHAYDVPYTTLHVGVISGGTALNIVPNRCQFDFEIRHLPDDQPDEILALIRQKAEKIIAGHKTHFPQAAINLNILNSYPALDTPEDSSIIELIKSLTGENSCGKVVFGTESGLFSTQLGIPTIVIGPGDIAQAHKPNEFIAISQLDKCDKFLADLANELSC